MQDQSFIANIFIPNKGFDWRLTSSRLLYGSSGILVIFGIVVGQLDLNYDQNEQVKIVFFALMILALIGARWGAKEKERIFGLIEGQLEITTSYLSIKDKRYYWDSISNFSFNVLQVKGEPLHALKGIYKYYGGPAFSGGVNNYIKFTSSGKTVNIKFELSSYSHKFEFEKLFKALFVIGHIELTKTYNGLHLEYEEIQEIKKERAEYLTSKSL